MSDEQLLNCDGYRKVLAEVERDETKSPGFHNYRAKLSWVIDRAKHYAEKTGLKAEDILDAWEAQRDYWYMNYYQDGKQPEIRGEQVRVFETTQQLLDAIGNPEFRCPSCGEISSSPYACNSGAKTSSGVCDWKVYGLFRDLGKGVTVFVKDQLRSELLFMPIAWEKPSTLK